MTGREFRWACVDCLMNGRADSAEHALALGRAHDAFACPAKADGPVEYRLRCARRADLSRRYPEEAPPWDEKRHRFYRKGRKL